MKDSSLPLVSFKMPVFNAGRYIANTLESVIHQSFKNWELIIIDDLSTDNSLEIAEKYAYSDSRIRIIRRAKNSGHAFTPRKEAAQAAQTEIISPIDADDLIETTYLEKLLDCAKSEDISLVYPTMRLKRHGIDMEIPDKDFDRTKAYRGKDLIGLTLNGWEISANGGIIDKNLYLRCMSMLERTNYIFSDETLTRILLSEANKVRISDAIYFYNINEESVTNRVSSKRFDYLTADKCLADFLKSKNILDSENLIKMEIQRFLNIVNAIRDLNDFGKRLNRFGRLKVRRMIQDAYSSIDWKLLKPNVGWKYYKLMRLGIPTAAIFMKFYDRFSKQGN